MKAADIHTLFDSFSHMKVLVVGDVMLDTYIWGKVERISPEAPVPVVSCMRKEHRLGGAGNVVVNLLSMGAQPYLCAATGKDESGYLIREIFKQLHLESQGLMVLDNRPTTVKTRIISGSQHIVRIDEETEEPLAGETERNFIDHLMRLMTSYRFDALIFQDYDKGVITPNVIHETVEQAKKQNIPVLVDPKKKNFRNYKNVTLFKPNFKEFCEGMKVDLAREQTEELFRQGQKFQQAQGIELLMITLSDKGIFISDGSSYHLLPAHKIDLADVSGAGDTVISVASLCLAARCTPYQIAAIANLAGGQVCEKAGVVPVNKEQLKNACLSLPALF